MIRTLVVDDDYRVADIHRQYAEAVGGFDVVGVAHTSADALRLVDRLRPDLVLLDIYLPDMSGLEVLRQLREQRRPVDVIAITAAKDVATIRETMQGGAVHYLIKPFSFNAFRERLESYAAVRDRLAGSGEVDQAEVDRLYALLRTSHEEELPKGLSTATCDLVVASLRSSEEPLSAAELARRSGLSRVTARRYAEHLVETGIAVVTRQYGAPGRPEHRYALATDGHAGRDAASPAARDSR